MSNRERTTHRSRSEKSHANDWEVVLLADQIELELVGILGPAEDVPSLDEIEKLLVNDDKELLVLVEGFRKALCAVASHGEIHSSGAFSERDQSLRFH